jgi:hypothetical protein
MSSGSHALRGWWRYSTLTVLPFGTNAIATLCAAVLAFTEHRTFQVVLAALMTAPSTPGNPNCNRRGEIDQYVAKATTCTANTDTHPAPSTG